MQSVCCQILYKKREDEQGQDFYGNDSCHCWRVDDSCVLGTSDSRRHLVVEQVVLHVGDHPTAAFSLLVPAV